MKKRILAFLMAATVFVLLCSCRVYSEATVYAESEMYGCGDKIVLYDKESEKELGSVTIVKMTVLAEPGYAYEYQYDAQREEEIKVEKKYDAIVQIEYTYEFIDSSVEVTRGNFSVSSSAGGDCDKSPSTPTEPNETDNPYIVVAVENKGEYIDLEYRYRSDQLSCATIRLYF